MCDTIKSKYILANVLMKSDREITVAMLKRLRRRIEARIPNVFVDVSYDSVSSAVENYPWLFAWHNDNVARARGADEYYSRDYIDQRFNNRLPGSVKNRILRLI